MRIACLHTAPQHQSTFTALFKDHAPDAGVIHEVREDLLAEAQIGGLTAVAEPFMAAIGALGHADAVLCTCSTLGPLVDTIQSRKYIRIDRPAMEAAAASSANPLLALCLESAQQPALDLWADVSDSGAAPDVVMSQKAWAFFTDGDAQGFVAEIAKAVKAAVKDHDAIILGQASMAAAVSALTDLNLPIFATPDRAVARAIAVATT